MLKNEAKWLGEQINKSSRNFPLLNVGSQSGYFRSKLQPHIDGYIFNVAKEKGWEVIHTDIQNDEGVDLCGDLTDLNFLDILKNKKYNSILCSNLLEHVDENMRFKICEALEDIVRPGGSIWITVPFSFPYHPDPIDTYFRPSPEGLKQCFKHCDLVSSKIIVGESILSKWKNKPIQFIKFSVRFMLPFYRFNNWKGIAHQLMWLNKPVKTTAIQLVKR
ncbi:hypothetical protein [Endozoicomonas ascidiicola]|uniref:hypothetical protein n=1 Tax=Endozoicomonas ascidiicola TaxID=1698521 RepID=UPI00082FFD25|nr:hypothetical protein [Endozoicomonas ascidiicola]